MTQQWLFIDLDPHLCLPAFGSFRCFTCDRDLHVVVDAGGWNYFVLQCGSAQPSSDKASSEQSRCIVMRNATR